MAELMIGFGKKKPGAMPPPTPPGAKGKKPGLAIAIGMGPKPPGAGGPPPVPGAKGAAPPDDAKPDAPSGDSGKMDPDKAIVIRADEHCKDCENYAAESGECKVVSGYFQPEDACHANFKAMGNAEEEPDEDDAGQGMGEAPGGMAS